MLNFKNFYPVSKTLRFELKPIGKTLEHIRQSEILIKDEQKFLLSREVKKLLDEYYKIIINEKLANFKIAPELLREYFNNSSNPEQLKKIKTEMKKSIIELFNTKLSMVDKKGKTKEISLLKALTSAEVFKYLEEYLEKQKRLEDLEKAKNFHNYTTYFTGFFKNRESIFINEKKGSISHRIIDENLVVFLENIKAYSKASIIDFKKEIYCFEDEAQFLDITNFNNVLTQEGIEKYNTIIIGYSKEDGAKVQGLNEIINIYNQKNESKLSFLTPLNKQILSDRQTISFVLDAIEEDNTVFNLIDQYLKEVEIINIFDISNIDRGKIYIKNGPNISDLSQKIFNNWYEIHQALDKQHERIIEVGAYLKGSPDNRKKHFEKNDEEFSLKLLSDLLSIDMLDEIKKILNTHIELISDAIKKYRNINRTSIRNLKNDKNTIRLIKNLLDLLKEHQKFLQQFYVTKENLEKDSVFYNDFNPRYLAIKEIDPIYNKIRNYLTKKPFDISKIKINFNCSTLLNGWDLDKEMTNLGVILRKLNDETNRYNYYLGIINDKKIFSNLPETTNENYYEKMEYKLLSKAYRMLPKLFISAKEYARNLPEEFLNNYNAGKHTKGNLDKNFLVTYIRYMQKCLNERYSNIYNFRFRAPESYSQIDEFYKEIDDQAYSIKFKNIDPKFIDKCVSNGKLYLFQIYSKDFSSNSKGLPNNQTIYFESLFSEENLKHNSIRLNGQAEIFYRKASLEYQETHKANEMIKNKNKDNNKEFSRFPYPIVKNKRYTEDKFLFHCPITLNYNSANIYDINPYINKKISTFKHIIGIDRGERNLIYISVIDLKGNIIKQFSLNEIINEYNNNKYKTNYNSLLDNKMSTIHQERKTWEEIENIKELKEGYLSQVINKIKELVLEYNAIIVLENLNYGFKNSRKKVDKQVYQKFEIQLIKKLNYVIDKQNPATYTNALQLTNPINTLRDIGIQSGIVFYIPAWNTSQIDPTTGYVNLLSYIRYKNIEEAKENVRKIKDIRFNGEYYEFDIDFADYNPKFKETKTNWTVCTYGTRIKNRQLEKSKGWESIEVNSTNEFKNLFKEYNISLDNIREESLRITDVKFFERFINLFRLTLQTRNSKTGTDVDYILSPVKNKQNKFFDSREKIEGLPENADANGAYNIAQKGLMLLERIKNTEPNKKVDYVISNEEYLNYLQK